MFEPPAAFIHNAGTPCCPLTSLLNICMLFESILFFRPSLMRLASLRLLKPLFSYPLGDGVVLRVVHRDGQPNDASEERVKGVRAAGEASRYGTKKIAVGTLRQGRRGGGAVEIW